MTVTEFNDRRSELSCRICGEIGQLHLVHDPSGMHVRPHCDNCCSTRPLEGVQWLGQGTSGKPPRRAKFDISLPRLLEEFGDRCAMCGLHKDVADSGHIGYERHHCTPVQHGGEDGYVIPLCGTCHQIASALKRYADALSRSPSAAEELPDA